MADDADSRETARGGDVAPEYAGSETSLATTLSAIRPRFEDADGALFLSDFDGTLAPIVEDPEAAEPLDGVPAVFRALRDADDAATAVISGRALDDLRTRFGVEGIAYAGNHGLELRHEGETTVHPDARAARDAIGSLVERLEERLGAVAGCRVVDKRVTATVHHRQVTDDRVPEVRRTVRDAVDRADADLRTTTGKEIIEVRPGVDWDKGHAVDWLRERLVPDGEEWIALYVGDDRTDEDAFAALDGGIGIKVGHQQETDAPHRVDGPEDVRALARWIAGPGRQLLSL